MPSKFNVIVSKPSRRVTFEKFKRFSAVPQKDLARHPLPKPTSSIKNPRLNIPFRFLSKLPVE